jgi:uncharacterized protein (TIGR00296 family)
VRVLDAALRHRSHELRRLLAGDETPDGHEDEGIGRQGEIGARSPDVRGRSLDAEWDEVDLELSVLGPIEPVDHISEVVVGRDGLIVEFGRRRGLLLPQVAVEWKWNAEEFASRTCIKAGLPPDAWQKGAKLSKFEAEVFSESGFP